MTVPSAPAARGAFTLATDLDGTFAGGSHRARAALARMLGHGADGRLVYVTGRSTASWQELANEFGLPRPRVAITDVGTSVVDGVTAEPIPELEAALGDRWPGHDAIRPLLEPVDGLVEQDVRSPRRVSYDVVEGDLLDALGHVQQRLRDLDVEVVGSAGHYVDVLPGGVNKGTTLLRVLEWLGHAPEDTVVAGDSLNDLALFETGLKGIIVANAESTLKHRAGNRQSVYVASNEGADGILEGLAHFGLIVGADDG